MMVTISFQASASIAIIIIELQRSCKKGGTDGEKFFIAPPPVKKVYRVCTCLPNTISGNGEENGL